MKRKTIRLFTLLLALALCLGALGAAPAMAEDITFTDSASGLTFKVTSAADLTVEVTAGASGIYDGDSYTIPATVTYENVTYSVTAIGDSAFDYCRSLTSVTIPSSVTSIGSHAFDSCRSLTSVTIPSSVTSIGDDAFFASGLSSVTIPDSVTYIGRNAFADCPLDDLIIPTSVTYIGDNAFEAFDVIVLVNNSSDLTKITLTDNKGASWVTYQYAPPPKA